MMMLTIIGKMSTKENMTRIGKKEEMNMAGLFGGLFDFNHDGEMGCFERAMEFATFASIMDETEKEDKIDEIESTGLDFS